MSDADGESSRLSSRTAALRFSAFLSDVLRRCALEEVRLLLACFETSPLPRPLSSCEYGGSLTVAMSFPAFIGSNEVGCAADSKSRGGGAAC